MTSPQLSSPAPFVPAIYRLAIALTLVVFPLIWVGGLVTTYDAGMAVPDWPNTYGYNMFAYPVTTWLFGPFDLLVEHSHRLLGTCAGLISIGLVVACHWYERRGWFLRWSYFILLSVIAQGLLGGMRVVLDQRTFAMIHGCTGPLFFALAAATAVMSSRWWLDGKCVGRDGVPQVTPRGVVWLATSLLAASYIQLIIGAQLRHVTGAVGHGVFMGFVHLHLTFAGIVMFLALALAGRSLLSRQLPWLVGLTAKGIALMVLVQIGLGIGTWVVNYALPWQEATEMLARYTIQAKGFWESMIVTAHMATGSLIICLATIATLGAWRSRAAAVAKEVNWKWKQQVA